MALLSTAPNRRLWRVPLLLCFPRDRHLERPRDSQRRSRRPSPNKTRHNRNPVPVTLPARGWWRGPLPRPRGALSSGSCAQPAGWRHGAAAYLRQDVLLVVRLVLQGVVLRGSPRRRGGGLAGARRGNAGHAAGSHTQSEAEDQRQKPGHEGDRKGLRPPGERLGSGSWQGLGREGVWVRPGGWLLRAPSPAGCGRAGQAGAPRRPWSSPPAPAALTGVHGPPSASSSAEDSGGRRGPGSCRRGAPGGRLGAWGRAGSLGRGGSGPARAAGRGRSLALAERGRSLYCAGLGEGGGGARGGGRTGKRPGAPLRWAERPRGGAEGRPFSSCDHKWRRESSDPGPGP